MRTCIYPGSFDPFTNGHLDILTRACKLFDHVIIGLLHNSAKKYVFSLDEREQMIRNVMKTNKFENVSIQAFDGLLVDFAREQNACAIIRGLRAVTDFEYELSMAFANKQLSPEVETVFLMTSMHYAYLSASVVREIGSFGGDISQMIPAANKQLITERLMKHE